MVQPGRFVLVRVWRAGEWMAGAAISPTLTGLFFSIPVLFSAPFFFSGGLKIVYDLLLFREFRSIKPPEETK
jgi:hypothetical protein